MVCLSEGMTLAIHITQMKLTINHDMSSSHALDEYSEEHLSFTLFRISSSLKKLQKARVNEFDLTSKESKTLGFLTSVYGDFEFNGNMLMGGTINGFDTKYKGFGAVSVSPFTMMSVEDAQIDVHDFLAAGYSSQAARKVARKMLSGNDEIIGSDLNEEIHGRKGDDTITGGGGGDELSGGAGRDVFVYNSISDSEAGDWDLMDDIDDFDLNKDKLDFSALEANGAWKGEEFTLGIGWDESDVEEHFQQGGGPLILGGLWVYYESDYDDNYSYSYLDDDDVRVYATPGATSYDDNDMEIRLYAWNDGLTADNFIL